jgi:hypothetical protein
VLRRFGRLLLSNPRAHLLLHDRQRDRCLYTHLRAHETEVDRYISWPGQALAYKLGELTILGLRAEAQNTLGPKFDERGFHDRLLAIGSVPLTVMQQQMRAWIRQQRATKAAKH